MVIGAAIGYSLYTILSKRVLRKEQSPMVVAWGTALGALFLICTAVLVDGGRTMGTLTTTHVAILVYLSIVPTSIAVVAYFYLLQRIQASQASVALFLIPVFAVLWAVVLLREQVTWAMLIGGGLIIMGVALTLSRHSSLPAKSPQKRNEIAN